MVHFPFRRTAPKSLVKEFETRFQPFRKKLQICYIFCFEKVAVLCENVDSSDFDPPKSIKNDSLEKVLALARFLMKSFPNVALDCRFLMLFQGRNFKKSRFRKICYVLKQKCNVS